MSARISIALSAIVIIGVLILGVAKVSMKIKQCKTHYPEMNLFECLMSDSVLVLGGV